MEQDLKNAIKESEKIKRRQEKIERTIILLSGLLTIIMFSVIGISIYSDKGESISEPEINIVAKKDQKIDKETPLKEETVKKEAVKPTEKNIKNKVIAKEKKIETSKQKKKTLPIKQKKVEVSKKLSGYYIQAGAFSSKKRAESFLKTLNLKNAFISKEGKLYKVLIGSFKNRKEAYKFLKEKNIKGFVKKL